jgi:type IV pilus assembly protein PilC
MSETIKKLSPFEEKLNTWVSRYIFRIPFLQKMLFVHNLSIMIKAGLSLVAALHIISDQIEHRELKKIIHEITAQVEKGQELSLVLRKYPNLFADVQTSMIAAGEASGRLEQSLSQVSEQMKKSHELTSRLKGALIYPGVILIAMIGIGIEMVVFVLPKIIVMFKDFNTELPLATRILIATVNFSQDYALHILASFAGALLLGHYLLRQPTIRKKVHAITVRSPILGPIIKQINLAQGTLTLSSLLQSSLPIVDAVRITADVQSNLTYRFALIHVSESLKKGDTFSELLQQFPRLFPPLTTGMIHVGEESGQVENMLKELSEYYANEVDTIMKNFSTIIEPVMILIMGLSVAGIAVAVILPMYSLAQSF